MYFSTITRAMSFATMMLFFYDEIGLGSNNGFTDFKHPLNIPLITSTKQIDTFLYSPGWRCWGCTVCKVTGRQQVWPVLTPADYKLTNWVI